MRYHYVSGFSNFKLAQRTFVRSSAKRRMWFHLQMLGFLVIGIILAVIYQATRDTTTIPPIVLAPLLGGLVGGGVVAPLLRPWQMKKTYEVFNGKANEPIHVYLEVENDILVSGIEGRSEGRFQRSAVCRTAEDENMLLLFLGPKKFIYLPKNDMHESALDEVRRWLALPGAPEKC